MRALPGGDASLPSARRGGRRRRGSAHSPSPRFAAKSRWTRPRAPPRARPGGAAEAREAVRWLLPGSSRRSPLATAWVWRLLPTAADSRLSDAVAAPCEPRGRVVFAKARRSAGSGTSLDRRQLAGGPSPSASTPSSCRSRDPLPVVLQHLRSVRGDLRRAHGQGDKALSLLHFPPRPWPARVPAPKA